MVMERGRTKMTAWKKEEVRAAEVCRNKLKGEEVDEIPIMPGVTATQVRLFRAALNRAPPL